MKMKKRIALSMIALCVGAVSVNAQSKGSKNNTAERLKVLNEKLAVLNLEQDKLNQVDSAFATAYAAQQQLRADMKESTDEVTDKEAMKTKMKAIVKNRDASLKAIFTDEQFKKWKEEIEPTLRQQKPKKEGE